MKKITKSFSLITVGLLFCSFIQDEETLWDTLAKIEWKKYYEEELGFDVSEPIFSVDVLKLSGEEIEITGYIMPIDTEENYMVISRFPYANCFFCGGAGPETVMEVYMSRDKKYYNKKVTLKGKLALNQHDFYRLVYRLEKAKVVRVED